MWGYEKIKNKFKLEYAEGTAMIHDQDLLRNNLCLKKKRGSNIIKKIYKLK